MSDVVQVGAGAGASEVNARQWWSLVERRAARTPDLPMLVDNYDRRITFGVYRDLAERVAAGLAGLGVGPGVPVSWQLPATIEAAVLMSALARLDAVQNPVVPILREAEVDFIVGQLGTRLLVVPGTFRGFDHRAMAERIAARHGTQVLVCDPPGHLAARRTRSGEAEPARPGAPTALSDWLDDIALPLGDPATLPDPAMLPDPTTLLAPSAQSLGPTATETTGDRQADVRWVLYSSGTTGAPKGVRHTDASVIAGSNSMMAQLGFGPSDVLSVSFPIAHIGGTGVLALGLRVGCETILVDAFTPIEGTLVLSRHGATMLGSAAAHFHAYLTAQRAHGPEPLFPHLRLCMAGGAPNEPGLHERVQAELGGAGIMNGWGLTEFPMAGYPSPDAPQERLRTTAGRPGPGVRVRVVDPAGREVARGQEGELRLAGPQLFVGYVDAALDEGAFDEQGYLRTGDLGIHDEEGWLYITGRIKDIIVRNAENISALEVENVLLLHPAVAEVAVVALPDPRTGERAAAFVVLAEGTSGLELPDLVRHCQAHRLATFKIPEQLEILKVMPRNAMGKVIKKDLKESAATRATAVGADT